MTRPANLVKFSELAGVPVHWGSWGRVVVIERILRHGGQPLPSASLHLRQTCIGQRLIIGTYITNIDVGNLWSGLPLLQLRKEPPADSGTEGN